MNSEKYIGLDVHQATISVAVLDSTGKLVMESILVRDFSTAQVETLEREAYGTAHYIALG